MERAGPLRRDRAWATIFGMSLPGDLLSPKPARRSPLFRSRPDRLLVEEWVPNITLPPPPDTPLEEDDPEQARLDEHGLPTFAEEKEEEPGPSSGGPARLFVGMGQRGARVQAPTLEAEGADDEEEYLVGDDDFFVAELRLPRPEDSLPFRIGPLGGEDDEEEGSDVLLDAAEASDPELAVPDLERPFSVSLEAPDPFHLGAFGGADGVEDAEEDSDGWDEEALSAESLDALLGSGLEPLMAQATPSAEPEPEPAREEPLSPPPPVSPDPGLAQKPRPEPEIEPRAKPRASPVITDQHPRPRQVIRSRPFWTKDRPLRESEAKPTPVFQPRGAPPPSPVREKLFNWTNLLVLVAVLIIAAAVWVWTQGY